MVARSQSRTGAVLERKVGDRWNVMRRAPLARSEGLLVEKVGDETVIYDAVSKDAHCLKPLAAFVLEHCDGETRTAEIAALAEERLGEPMSEQTIGEVYDRLDACSLLDSPGARALLGGLLEGVSRREAMRRIALAGAAATPLITTIMSPTPAMAVSTRPNACTCYARLPVHERCLLHLSQRQMRSGRLLCGCVRPTAKQHKISNCAGAPGNLCSYEDCNKTAPPTCPKGSCLCCKDLGRRAPAREESVRAAFARADLRGAGAPSDPKSEHHALGAPPRSSRTAVPPHRLTELRPRPVR